MSSDIKNTTSSTDVKESTKLLHPEWKVENSLTAPEDRDKVTKPYKPIMNTRKLSEQEVVDAMDDLNNNSFTHKYLQVERRYADPPQPMQRIGLISWVPAKGATPNKNGVYGFAKIRGNYATEREASEQAETIIRNVDSYHQIFHCYVGRPFPLTLRSDFAKHTDEIDLQKEMNSTLGSSVREKRKEDEKIKKEVTERARRLQEDVKKESEDPYEVYTTLRVKKAQLIWGYLEYEKKMKETREILIRTRKEIEEMNTESPDYEKTYFDRYVQARKDAGLDDKGKNLNDNFMKYMAEDVDLGF